MASICISSRELKVRKPPVRRKRVYDGISNRELKVDAWAGRSLDELVEYLNGHLK